MKASQVSQPPVVIHPHWMKKDSLCHHCGKDIRPTYGVLVGNNTYCDHQCLADHLEEIRKS
jgi:hypothetical protein